MSKMISAATECLAIYRVYRRALGDDWLLGYKMGLKGYRKMKAAEAAERAAQAAEGASSNE